MKIKTKKVDLLKETKKYIDSSFSVEILDTVIGNVCSGCKKKIKTKKHISLTIKSEQIFFPSLQFVRLCLKCANKDSLEIQSICDEIGRRIKDVQSIVKKAGSYK